MRQVTKEEFFAALYRDSRYIMPRIVSGFSKEDGGYTAEWRTRDREVFGKSIGGGDNIRWWLVTDAGS